MAPTRRRTSPATALVAAIERRYGKSMEYPHRTHLTHGEIALAAAEMGWRRSDDVRLDETAMIWLTHGQCHALALALHSETAWPLMGCNHGDDGVPEHVFVRRPDGRGLDACGPHRRGEHPDALLRGDWKPMGRMEVEGLEGHGYEPPLVDVAGRYVGLLLRMTR